MIYFDWQTISFTIAFVLHFKRSTVTIRTRWSFVISRRFGLFDCIVAIIARTSPVRLSRASRAGQFYSFGQFNSLTVRYFDSFVCVMNVYFSLWNFRQWLPDTVFIAWFLICNFFKFYFPHVFKLSDIHHAPTTYFYFFKTCHL